MFLVVVVMVAVVIVVVVVVVGSLSGRRCGMDCLWWF